MVFPIKKRAALSVAYATSADKLNPHRELFWPAFDKSVGPDWIVECPAAPTDYGEICRTRLPNRDRRAPPPHACKFSHQSGRPSSSPAVMASIGTANNPRYLRTRQSAILVAYLVYTGRLLNAAIGVGFDRLFVNLKNCRSRPAMLSKRKEAKSARSFRWKYMCNSTGGHWTQICRTQNTKDD